MEKVTEKDFEELLLNNTPFIDVRSENEFSKGSIPNSINMPILRDPEREKVGICYKNEGQKSAIELGNKLVCGDKKKDLVQSWKSFKNSNKKALIYCARGGLRSQISQKWIMETGDEIKFVDGGFKSLRNYLIKSLEEKCSKSSFIVLGGPTGSGKTILLKQFKDMIDLEHRANHRGSSFGRHLTNQPAQIDFENNISLDLIKIFGRRVNNILIEDESRLIGTVHLPEVLKKKMAKSDIVILKTPMELRVDSILNEYVKESLDEYLTINPDGFDTFMDLLFCSLKRISKKLGGLKHSEIHDDMVNAFGAHKENNNLELHRIWIEKLLTHYYDPMYNYSLEKRSEQVIFKGTFDEIIEWAQLTDAILQ
jgi:tRNA 2-selenouridine synthase